ncbi:3'-5' exonuclease [Sulfurospirillum sp. T05]|uniref:3'-5' exonuclease n=1 Tax=Sulfurospirillum tamanense TaxID=2813362 RepID=A0ABS2WTY0_9BACT|nr:3'-5' exonuclease [Sulfurospirillum tamanensis]MBN2965092.1 3'-5' exonuclease [Sulfurospirillum tamanensis]
MFTRFFKERNKKKLRDPRFLFLFDDSFSEDEFVVFDTETTGLDPKKDEILSIGAVKIKGNKILAQETLSLLLRPSKDIAAKSITIHQLRNIDMVGALAPEEALERFLAFIGPLPLVGYYLEFDVAMVNRYLQPWLGIKLPNAQIEVSGIYHDKKIKAIPDGVIDLRFDTIMRELGLPIFGKHDAVNDAIMTAMMFVKLQNIQRL